MHVQTLLTFAVHAASVSCDQGASSDNCGLSLVQQSSRLLRQAPPTAFIRSGDHEQSTSQLENHTSPGKLIKDFARKLGGIAGAKSGSRPNIVFVLADDLGWGEVGFHYEDATVHNNEVRTPSIDRLVKNGIHLHRHYVHPNCAPTRISVQSGRLPVHVTTENYGPYNPKSGMPLNMTTMAEKMQEAGYKTHYVGKWDVGMATRKHLPVERGYSSSLHYFNKDNDQWTSMCIRDECRCAEDLERGAPEGGIVDLWDGHGPARDVNGTKFQEYIFLERIEKIIDEHDVAHPLFLFYAPHVAHPPLQIPEEYYRAFDFVKDDPLGRECGVEPGIKGKYQAEVVKGKHLEWHCRRQMRASVWLLDSVVGRIVTKLKNKALWEDTLLVFSSDNGGSLDHGGTNYPLRAGKGSLLEGGVRSAAFVAGGAIPRHMRGRKMSQIMHIADWYATFADLAGVSAPDRKAEFANLPPIDSISMWPLLSGLATTSPRREVPLGEGIIFEKWKLLTGKSVKTLWSGPLHPTTGVEPGAGKALDCSAKPCLFDLEKDMGEVHDLASKYPEVVSSLKARLQELSLTFFEAQTDLQVVSTNACIAEDPEAEAYCMCWMAKNHYGGFFGPFHDVELTPEASNLAREHIIAAKALVASRLAQEAMLERRIQEIEGTLRMETQARLDSSSSQGM